MNWEIKVWKDEECRIVYADTFFDVFEYFTSCVMDLNCEKCIVTACVDGKPIGNAPVLTYDVS